MTDNGSTKDSKQLQEAIKQKQSSHSRQRKRAAPIRETGSRQVLPLKKDLTQLLQLGVVGYDQWQVTDNGGTFSLGGLILPASILPHYSVHAIGGEICYIAPVKNLTLNFKYYNEYSAHSTTLGNTIVFGGTWTLPSKKSTPPGK